MGGQAEKMIGQSVQALITGDVELARQVVESDLILDNAQADLDDRAVCSLRSVSRWQAICEKCLRT